MKHRKQIFVTLFAALVLGITACGNGKSVNNSGEAAVGKNTDSGNVVGNNYFAMKKSMVATQNGIYFLQNNTFTLFYMDYKTKQTIYTCAKPDCSHTILLGAKGMRENTCDAFMGAALNYSLGTDGTDLYVITDYNEDTGDVDFVSISPDGAVHTKLGKLGKTDTWGSTYEYVIDNEVMYYVYTPYSIKDESIAIRSTPVDKVDSSIVYESDNSIRHLIKSEDELFFYEYDADAQSPWGSVSSVNVNTFEKTDYTGKLTNCFSYGMSSDGKKLYYVVTGEGVYEYELSTGNTRLLIPVWEQFVCGNIATDDEHIYIDNSNTVFYYMTGEERDGKCRIFVYDYDGKYLSELLVNSIMRIPQLVKDGYVYAEGSGKAGRAISYAKVLDSGESEFITVEP